MNNNFKFKFRDRKKHHKSTDVRSVWFDWKQLDGYSVVAKHLFVHCMLAQLMKANNCTIRLDHELFEMVEAESSEYDKYIPRETVSMYLKRMMVDWCSNSVNISFIDSWKDMLELFEIFKTRTDGINEL
jgi:hypothetical protein